MFLCVFVFMFGVLVFRCFGAVFAAEMQLLINIIWCFELFGIVPNTCNVFMDLIDYDEIIEYERFNDDMRALVRKFYPKADHSLTSQNRAATNSDELVNEYFNAQLKTVAQKIYAIDFESFGYK